MHPINVITHHKLDQKKNTHTQFNKMAHAFSNFFHQFFCSFSNMKIRQEMFWNIEKVNFTANIFNYDLMLFDLFCVFVCEILCLFRVYTVFKSLQSINAEYSSRAIRYCEGPDYRL